MKAAATALVLAGAGLLTGHALAGAGVVPDALTITVSTSSVTVPVPAPPPLPSPPPVTAPVRLPPPPAPAPAPAPVPVPVPVPQLPKPPISAPAPPAAPLPTPRPPDALPSTPTAPAVATASQTVQSASGTRSDPSESVARAAVLFTGGSRSGGGSSTSGSSSGTDRSSSNQTRVNAVKSSRSWIATTGPKRRRFTTLTFTVPRAMRLLFVVQQVSPVCRIVDRFAIDAKPGRNRVRFPGKASRLQLAAGTYRISARTPSGRLVRRVTLVVVGSGIPSRNEIAAARAANVCASARRLVSAAGGSTGASNTGALSDGPVFQRSASGGSPDRGANSHSGAVLGASVEEAARALQPILIALLALAIMLLAVASLPRTAVLEPRANDLLARHRSEIAGLGAAAFVAVVIAFLLG